MATADIRFKRLQGEYRTLQDAQDELFDKMDSYEAALLGLNETVVANHELNQRQFAEIRQDVSELNEKLDRLMAHLKVPPKPPAGFVKE